VTGTRLSAGDGGAEAGVTLVETVVAMALVSVFMAVFITGVVQMHQSVRENESMSEAQSQINIAFQRLDREVRYASGISIPGQTAAPSSIPYVEYRTAPGGTPRCTQLRLYNRILQMRTWNPATTATPPAGWRPLVTSTTTATPATGQPAPIAQAGPFAVWTADSTRVFQRLRVSLRTTAGAGQYQTGRETSIVFTALNTSADTEAGTVCMAPRPTS
jgi:type II secretory pathway pseudopilin PulG